MDEEIPGHAEVLQTSVFIFLFLLLRGMPDGIIQDLAMLPRVRIDVAPPRIAHGANR
jgi:hypothetical protein